MSIHSLPPELLSHLLLTGALLSRNSPVYSETFHSFLLSTSLVCRVWHSESLPILHRTIQIKNDYVGQRLLAGSTFGEYVTNDLVLTGYDVGGEVARGVLERVKGVKRVELNGFKEKVGLDWKAFQSPSLRDVKSLTLLDTFLHDSSNGAPFSLPFSLKSLNLYLYFSPRPSSLSFATPTLTHFSINELDTPSPSRLTDIVSLLQSLSPHLLSFSTSIDLTPFLSTLSLCTSLTSLTTRCWDTQLSTILSSLSPNTKLKTLALRSPGDYSLDSEKSQMAVAVRKVMEMEVLRDLRRLEFPWINRVRAFTVGEMKELVEEVGGEEWK